MYKEIQLSGLCFSELNTEIRFSIAVARASGDELLKLTLPKCAIAQDNIRLANCFLRTIRAVIKQGLAEFFVPSDLIDNGSTESEYLINKYSAYLSVSDESENSYYVKI